MILIDPVTARRKRAAPLPPASTCSLVTWTLVPLQPFRVERRYADPRGQRVDPPAPSTASQLSKFTDLMRADVKTLTDGSAFTRVVYPGSRPPRIRAELLSRQNRGD